MKTRAKKPCLILETQSYCIPCQFCPFSFLPENKLTKGGRPQTMEGNEMKTNTKQEVLLMLSIYAESMLKYAETRRTSFSCLEETRRKPDHDLQIIS